MPTAPGQNPTSRRRRREAVVCTGCRRRKIACDRNTPCAQCIQASLECVYYNSYAHSDFQIDRHSSSAQPKSRSNSTVSNTQVTRQGDGSRPHSDSLANVDYEKNFFSVSNLNVASTIPATISMDLSAPTWFETETFGPSNPPLNTPPNSSVVRLFSPDSRTAPSDASPRASRSALPSPPSHSDSFSTEPGKLLFSKSRLCGPTHWITILRKYEQQGLFDDVVSVLFQGEGHPLLQKCKRLVREVKSQELDSRSLSRPLQEYMPAREICDKLIQLYLRTFETVLRVLHVPSFQRDYLQYWSNPHTASESFVLQLLLIMAIGTCFDHDPVATDGASSLHCQATHWIHACHLRLTAPFRKKHLNLRGVQSQCLLVIALLTNTNATKDLAWISVASLLQSAMAVGLHIAPSQLPVSSLEAEMRRRLWATILELAVQCSLDSGIHPIISAEALNCEFPSNLNDSQISDSTETLPIGHLTTTFTQSSIQCALLISLPIRLRIAEALSRFQGELSYDMALRMGEELTAACRETSKLIDSFLASPSSVDSARPSAFQIKIQDLLARRFLLLLHTQFAHKATSDVSYHFSRTVCQECSLLLLSPTSSQDSESIRRRKNSAGDDSSDNDYGSDAAWSSLQDYANLQLFGDGLFKNVFLAASLTVCAEVLQQLREDSSPATSSLSRRELLQAIEHAALLTRRRVRAGETSVKAAAFFACTRAQINAHRAFQPRASVVADAARTALGECCVVLEARLREQNRSIITDLDDLSGGVQLNSSSVTNHGGSSGGGTSSVPWVNFSDPLVGDISGASMGGSRPGNNNLPVSSRTGRNSESRHMSFDGSEFWHATSWEDNTNISY